MCPVTVPFPFPFPFTILCGRPIDASASLISYISRSQAVASKLHGVEVEIDIVKRKGEPIDEAEKERAIARENQQLLEDAVATTTTGSATVVLAPSSDAERNNNHNGSNGSNNNGMANNGNTVNVNNNNDGQQIASETGNIKAKARQSK